ncbi:hypothetical protein NKH74_16570 [Mesorhizobium sp. M0933]|uniref:hypothetical protein n=1 Tax=Mesorhizobium sp. M0933 TaxID=2957030 RepID=UPI00333C2B7F
MTNPTRRAAMLGLTTFVPAVGAAVAAPRATAASRFSQQQDVPTYATAVRLSEVKIPAAINSFRTTGYAAVGDRGAATYVNVVTEPTHGGKIRTADGAWWELAEADVITAEMFGAVGDGTIDDDTSMTAMCSYGRAHGCLHWVGVPGKVYTTKHASMFANIEYLTLDFNGAAIKNTLGSGSPKVGFVSNIEGLHFGTIFQSNGHRLISGGYYNGETIASASAGDAKVEVTGRMGGTGLTAGARVFIYGFSGSGGKGYPPDPRISEYNEIENVDGNVLTLRRRLKYDYDSRWPDGSAPFVFGAPRIISADRSDFTAYRRLIINDMNVVRNPSWTAGAATLQRNGRVTVGGYDYCQINRGRIDGGMYASQGQYLEVNGIDLRGGIEFDKCVDEVVCRKLRCLAVGAAVGVRSLVLEDVECQDLWNLSPIKNLTVKRGRLVGLSASRISVLGATSSLTENLFIDGTEFVVTGPTKTCLISSDYREITITVESSTQLSLSRDDFDASGIARFMAPDTVLYTADGSPAFQLYRLPYNEDHAVYFEGESLTSLATNDVLRAYGHRNVKTQNLSLTGAYAKQVRLLGRDIPTPVNFDTAEIGPHFFAFDQRLLPATGGALSTPIGRRMWITRITVNVLRAYTGASAKATLQLRSRGGPLLFAVDLKMTGQRVIDASGTYNLKAGDHGAIQYDPIVRADIRVTNSLEISSDDEGALWYFRCEGVRSPQ